MSVLPKTPCLPLVHSKESFTNWRESAKKRNSKRSHLPKMRRL